MSNAADPKALKAAKSRRERDLRDLVAVMQTDAGRRVLARLLAMTGFTNAGPMHTNGLQMAYANGTRNVGAFLNSELVEASLDLYQQMQREAMNEEQTDG